jgi:glycerophosphoryl diester phosphodiesterase
VDKRWRWPRRRVDEPILLLAHRGGRGPWRENTLEAFAGALREGADGVELDVRRTADGELVVHHDAEIAEVGAVHALRRADLPSWIPTLDQALAACAAAAVNVEVKNSPVDPGYDPTQSTAIDVVDRLTALGDDRSGPAQVIVSSFFPATIAAARTAAPAVATGLLVHPSLDAVTAARQASDLGCVALHPFHRQATPDLVTLVHDMDMAVVVWTVNEERDLVSMAEAEVDGLISDHVAEARSVLVAR